MNMITSAIDPVATLEYLCTTDEHQYLERKGVDERGMAPGKVADELVGMLNADGGILALGISDDGIVQDLRELDAALLLRYEKIMQEFITPPACIELEKLVCEDGKLVFLYHVAQDYENLYERKDNHKVYKRIADSNFGPLDNDEIDKLRHDKNLRKYEDQECPSFDISTDLDIDLLEQYRQKIGYKGTHEELLIKRNLAVENRYGDLVVRNSAVLLFALDPDKYIPSAYLRYLRYNGSYEKTGKNFNVTKDIRVEGGIPRIIDETRKLLNASLDDYYFLDSKTGRFLRVSEYPEDAWLEGVVNALFHRSYNLQGNCMYLKHFDDRLEISNSGPLPAQVTVENIRRQRFSRNSRIGRVLTEMGYVRELNEGVKRIYDVMEESMLTEPRYIDSDNIVQLILENKVSGHKSAIPDDTMQYISMRWTSFAETERLIIEKLSRDQEATVDELSEFCGVTEKSVRTYLNAFIRSGYLVKDSEKQRDRNAKYRFRKNNDT